MIIRSLHFCSKTNPHGSVGSSSGVNPRLYLTCDWRLGAVALTSFSLIVVVFLQKDEGSYG